MVLLSLKDGLVERIAKRHLNEVRAWASVSKMAVSCLGVERDWNYNV